MMRDLGINFTVNVDVENTLKKLKTNRKRHLKAYKESVAGFKDHALGKIKRALEKVDGTADVYFRLEAPKNYTSAYDSAIGALTMHLEAGNKNIDLDASTVRKMTEDKWDWMDSWLTSNSGYSSTAQLMHSKFSEEDDWD